MVALLNPNPSAVVIRHPKPPKSPVRAWLESEVYDFRHLRANQDTLENVADLLTCRDSIRHMLATITADETHGPRPIQDTSAEYREWEHAHARGYRSVATVTDDHLERIARRVLLS